MKTQFCILASAMMVSLFTASYSHADVFRIDLQPTNIRNHFNDGNTEALATGSNAVFGDDGTNEWNEIGRPNSGGYPADGYNYGTNPESFALVNSQNAAGSVAFYIYGGEIGGFTGPISLGSDALREDYVSVGSYTADPDIDWAFTGLAPNSAFALALYGDGSGGDRAVNFSLDLDGNGSLETTLNGNNSSGYDYFYVTGVASASGQIQGMTSSNDGYWNGLQLSVESVPEPSTIALAAIGLMGLGWFGVRRRKA